MRINTYRESYNENSEESFTCWCSCCISVGGNGCFWNNLKLREKLQGQYKEYFSLEYLIQIYAQSPPNMLVSISCKQRHSPTQQNPEFDIDALLPPTPQPFKDFQIAKWSSSESHITFSHCVFNLLHSRRVPKLFFDLYDIDAFED